MASQGEKGFPFDIDERDFVWHVAALAVYGLMVTAVLALYSDTRTLHFRYFEIATTQFSWAFAPLIAYVVDRSRDMFRTKSEIRAAAREKVREEGRKEMLEWMRSKFEERGQVFDPEIEEEAREHFTNGKA